MQLNYTEVEPTDRLSPPQKLLNETLSSLNFLFCSFLAIPRIKRNVFAGGNSLAILLILFFVAQTPYLVKKNMVSNVSIGCQCSRSPDNWRFYVKMTCP